MPNLLQTGKFAGMLRRTVAWAETFPKPLGWLVCAALLCSGLIFVIQRFPSPVPSPQENPTPASPIVPSHAPQPNAIESDAILRLFPPQGPMAKQRETMENTLLITFLLARCGLMTHREYTKSFRAMVLFDAGKNPAPDALRKSDAWVRELAKSASARYTMLYGKIPCNQAQLAPQAQALQQWREAILAQE